jgi:hypothetical protein
MEVRARLTFFFLCRFANLETSVNECLSVSDSRPEADLKGRSPLTCPSPMLMDLIDCFMNAGLLMRSAL